MATVQCNMQFVSNMSKVQRTGELCSQHVQQKLLSALQFAAQASVYATESTVVDLSVSQSILLTIMYGLLKGDVGFCLALIEVSKSIVQLKSSYLKVWLSEDFNFQKQDIVEMFSNLSQMTELGLLHLPRYISASFSTLVEKYGLSEHFNMSGDTRAALLVSEVNSYDCKQDNPSESESSLPGSSSEGLVESLISLSEDEIQLRLRKAVHNNNPTAIAALIDAGANVDDELDNGDTLLHLAVSNSHVEAVNLLLKSGVIPNWRNKDYITPLQMAVGLNNSLIVEALVRSGAEVNQRSTEGCTLLHEAASKGNTHVLKILVRLGAVIDSKNICGQTPLHLATKANHLEAVEALVEAGADINILSDDGEAALHIAVSKGYSKILKSLIRSEVDLNIKTKSGQTVLHLAKDRHTVKLLTKGGASINIFSETGDTPLHCAALNGCIEVAKALIASNATIDCLNNKKATPLSVAVKAEQSEMVRLLVASGANVNFKDKEDIENSLLHWAVQEEKLNCVQLLLDAGADVNIQNVHNNTPLHYAASVGNMTITELLLNKGSTVNIHNNKGEAPYRYAALNGHLQVAQLLLDKGAKTSSIKIYDLQYMNTVSSHFKFGTAPQASGAASQFAAENQSLHSSDQPPSNSDQNQKAQEQRTIFSIPLTQPKARQVSSEREGQTSQSQAPLTFSLSAAEHQKSLPIKAEAKSAFGNQYSFGKSQPSLSLFSSCTSGSSAQSTFGTPSRLEVKNPAEPAKPVWFHK